MRQTIENFIKQREELETQFKEWLKDKSIPLEERWETFVLSGMGDHESWSQDFDSLPEEFIAFDGPYSVYRHETVEMRRVVEKIKEKHEDNEWEYVNLEELQEEILEKFLKSFEYDW